MSYQLLLGDCLQIMPSLPANSIDSIVCDPPYMLNFMGKAFDRAKDNPAASVEVWREALRVAKPGAHLLAFGGDRTHHRMMVAIEDAGWEIRTCLYWLFGSGFPKSMAIDKAIDKAAGAEREVIGVKSYPREGTTPVTRKATTIMGGENHGNVGQDSNFVTAPATDAARQWAGWGTALKPSVEIIVCARKPLSEPTIAANVLKWNCGALNIDACRIGTEESLARPYGGGNQVYGKYSMERGTVTGEGLQGRWPANLILSEDAAALLDEMSGVSSSKRAERGKGIDGATFKHVNGATNGVRGHDDQGGASRFFLRVAPDEDEPLRMFYCPKASAKDRNSGLDGTCTVKYNIDKSNINSTGDLSWKDVSTVLVALLEKATCDLVATKWRIGESGESIMGQCPSDSLSTTLTAISRITTSQILSLLTHSLISDCIAGVNCEMENGGSLVGSVASSRLSQLTITLERVEALARGVKHVVSPMLSQISDGANWKPTTNIHSTVKPTALMRWLVRLVTPPNGTVLDCFAGSGSTLKAAILEGFDCIGIDNDAEYLAIADARCAHAERTKAQEQPMLLAAGD